jgi:hypothetical protein
MGCTHEDNCDALLTPRIYNVRAGNAAWKYILRRPGRRQLEADAFRRLEQRLLQTGSVTVTTHVNGGRPRAVRTPDNEDDTITTVSLKRQRRSRDIARELGVSQPTVLEVLHDEQYHYSRSACVSVSCKFSNSYVINALRMAFSCLIFC